jgi:hypothetical protein
MWLEKERLKAKINGRWLAVGGSKKPSTTIVKSATLLIAMNFTW